MQQAGWLISSQHLETEKPEGKHRCGNRASGKRGTMEMAGSEQSSPFPLQGASREGMAPLLLHLTLQMTVVLSNSRMPPTPFISAVNFLIPLLGQPLPPASPPSN